MVEQTIRWGIIGCGDVTEVKSGPAFKKVPDSFLVAVMRRDGAKAADYARRHNVPKWHDDATRLINDPDLNAVYIATPPAFHEEFTIAALQAGKPVYVEKPMATSVAACQRMQDAATATNGKLSVAHYRRALPVFLKIKELLDRQAVGDIRTVRLSMLQSDKSSLIAQTVTNWRVDPAISGGGLFFDLAPHQLDLMLYFFGAVADSYGISANQAALYAAEDVVAGLVHFKNNVIFSGQWCFTAGEGMNEDRCEITGSKGKISFPIFGHEITIERGWGKEVFPFDPPAHVQQPMIGKVVDYFLGRGPNPCSAADAIQSMQLMEKFISPAGNPS